MEAWAAAKWMRTSLHWLTLVPAGLRRTVCEVPEKVPGEEAHVPILLLSQVAHLQKPGLGLPHWTGLNHAPCFQTLLKKSLVVQWLRIRHAMQGRQFHRDPW